MVLPHTFCFVFSLRLGAILIGIATLIKSSVWMILTLWGLESISQFSKFLFELLEDAPVLINAATFLNLEENFSSYLIGLATFYGINVLMSILLQIGAYQCKPSIIYPFLFFYILYILSLCLDMAMIYLLITRNSNGLDVTIIFFSVTFFVSVFCIYTWCCVYNLIQVINILNKKVLNQIKSRSFKRIAIIPETTSRRSEVGKK